MDLLAWFRRHKRRLPWRKTRDPYRIWVSEVMLQQTRVATVVPYYNRFIERFPSLAALAEATDAGLMKAWEGLGYYRRALNLRRTARKVITTHAGRLPTTRAELAELPGFGPYTSASVASIAFGEACAAVDGNVMRVLSRLYLVESDIRQPSVRREFEGLADSLLPARQAGRFNEAMMELGATVCTPRSASCAVCPIGIHCRAYATGRVNELPRRSKKPAIPHYEIAVGVIHKRGRVLIALRPAEGLLGNLWEFPGGKRKPDETLEQCCAREILEETGLRVRVGERFAVVRHAYSHFRITLSAFHCAYLAGAARPRTSQQIQWVRTAELEGYAFPKANKTLIKALKAEALS